MQLQHGDGPSEESTSVQDAMDSIASRLRELRVVRGLGIRELARRVGVTPSLLSQMERSSVNPSVVTLFRLAEALGTTTDY
ncbi:MAG TPA: helix-turn-helix transcriptional regulator, partial [Chloroflexota bacterium]